MAKPRAEFSLGSDSSDPSSSRSSQPVDIPPKPSLDSDGFGVGNSDIAWVSRASSLQNKGRRRSLTQTPTTQNGCVLGTSAPAGSGERAVSGGGGPASQAIKEEDDTLGPMGSARSSAATARDGKGGSANGGGGGSGGSGRSRSNSNPIKAGAAADPARDAGFPRLQKSATIGPERAPSVSPVPTPPMAPAPQQSQPRRAMWLHSLSSKLSSQFGHGSNGQQQQQHQQQHQQQQQQQHNQEKPVMHPIPPPQTQTHGQAPGPGQGQKQDRPQSSPINIQTPSSRILDSHPPRTASPKITQESAVGSPETARSPEVSRAGSFVNRLRRISTRANSVSETPAVPEPRVVLNRNHSREPCKVPELRGALPLRVSFAEELVQFDPPQQIPSRNPRPGNITFSPNGEINVGPHPHPSLGTIHYSMPKNYAASARTASSSAHESALRVAAMVKQQSSGGGAGSTAASLFRTRTGSVSSSAASAMQAVDDDQLPSSASASSLKIDKPMANTAHGFGSGGTSAVNAAQHRNSATGEPGDDDDGSESGGDEPDTSLTSIYTRCCHLREILPITATLKQLKNQKAPLPVIRIMNPRPTLIEVLSFSDFLSVAPIRMVILDGVSLSNEMLRYILTALQRSTCLVKLSLRNVILDEIGWRMLCAFVVANTSLLKLDLTMQKTKGDTALHRSNLDWDLLTKALDARGGIEELLVNGCMVPSQAMEAFILRGCRATKRLGLAMNDLHKEDFDVLLKWFKSDSCVCEGLDLGGNDLTAVWREVFDLLNARSLLFVSFNATNVSHVDHATAVFEMLVRNHSQLRFLDFSNNPAMFPSFTPVLAELLPKFEELRRIHLDSDNLEAEDIKRLSKAFAVCPKLVHVSLLDNVKFDWTACAALTAAVHLSNSIYTVECQIETWPPALQKIMASYCLSNMEIQAGRITPSQKEHDEYQFSGASELAEVGNAFTHAAEDILRLLKDEDRDNTLAESLTRRAQRLRGLVRESIEELVRRRREKDNLSTEEKEELVKLCFLDGNLESVLNDYAAQGQTVAPGGAPMHMSEHMFSLGPRAPANRRAPPVPGAPDFEISAMNEQEHAGQLSRASSSTSLHRREQELEEGHFHKLGTYMERRRSSQGADDGHEPSVVPGEQIRQAVLKAKGEHNASGVIARLEDLYGPEIHSVLDSIAAHRAVDSDSDSHPDSDGSIPKLDEQSLDRVVDDIARVL